MCTTCGCGSSHSHTHLDENGNIVTHTHDDHDHHHEAMSSRKITVEQDILARNNAVASRLRTSIRPFAKHHILALNLVSSPGSGKTELLCATVRSNLGMHRTFGSLKAISRQIMTPNVSVKLALRQSKSIQVKGVTWMRNR